MKRKSIVFIGGVLLVVGVTFNLSSGLNNSGLSDLALANIEALARYEEGNRDCDENCEFEARCWVMNILLGHCRKSGDKDHKCKGTCP